MHRGKYGHVKQEGSSNSHTDIVLLLLQTETTVKMVSVQDIMSTTMLV